MAARFGPPPATARLALRNFTEHDVDALHALDSDPRVMRYIGDGQPSTREEAEAAIGRVLRRYVEHPGQGVWHVSRRDDGRFIGWVSLKFAGDSPDVEVGYRLVHAAWGQGFATEAGAAMLARGFDVVGLDRIIGVTHAENAASQRVLMKIGMRDEGWGRYYDRDLRLFAIERERWRDSVRKSPGR
jgi:RimJ/RimL family protein N-acetyltransferase